MMNNRLILVGGGAFARELINWVEDLVDLGKSHPITGFLDESSEAFKGFPYSLTYLGSIPDYEPQSGDQLLMAIGDPKAKKAPIHRAETKRREFFELDSSISSHCAVRKARGRRGGMPARFCFSRGSGGRFMRN